MSGPQKRELDRRALLKSIAVLGSLGVASPALLSACSSSSSSGGNGSGGASKKTAIHAGLTTSIAGLGDNGFNDLAASGVKQAEKKLGVNGTVVEAHQETDYVPDLTGLVNDGDDLVYAVGFLMQDALTQVAQQFSSSKFGIVDAVVDLPNVASNVFRAEQSSFLAGAFAAMMTLQSGIPKMRHTKILGFIGGGDVPLIHNFQKGYEQGVKYVDPSIKVLVGYANSFTDPVKGKQLAVAQYQAGADIIYQAAGPTGTGVIDAAKQGDRYVIGVDADQNSLAPSNVITSAIKKVDVAVFNTIKSVADGSFKSGKNVFDLKNGGVGLAPFHSLGNVVPSEVKSKLDDTKRKVISGAITVKETTT